MSALNGQSVLVATSDANHLQLLQEKLSEHGCLVTPARNAAEAMDLARDLDPKVILLAAAMDGMDGFDVCRRLKRDEDTQAIPVLFLVDRDRPVDKMYGLQLGGQDFIALPADDADLLARITTAVQLKTLRDTLALPAEKDDLTGLLNRTFFDEEYQRECNRARRYDSLFALVVVDLDHFREINRAHGLATGDRVLAEAASVLRAKTRESDYVARWGGNEFMILLPEGNLPKAIGFAKKLYTALSNHDFGPPDNRFRLSVSLGVASRQNLGGRDPGELIKLVQECLHSAKAEGGDRIVYHTCGEFNPVRL